MEYKKIKPSEVKEMAETDLEKALGENDLAHKETEEKLATAETKIKTLEDENAKLKENQKEPEEEKSGIELAKELF